jgi:hypothetical protein
MGGWAQNDTSGVFGQWISGMARMYKATGDTEMGEKAAALMNGKAEAYRKDGSPLPRVTGSYASFRETWSAIVPYSDPRPGDVVGGGARANILLAPYRLRLMCRGCA